MEDNSDFLWESVATAVTKALQNIERRGGATILAGPPGTGKTTALEYLAAKKVQQGMKDFVFVRSPDDELRRGVFNFERLAGKLVLWDNADPLPLTTVVNIIRRVQETGGHIVFVAGTGVAIELMKVESLRDRVTPIFLSDSRPAAAALTWQQRRQGKEPDPSATAPEPLDLLVDPGDASAEDLTRLYLAMSDIYRAYGGEGLIFDPDATTVSVQAGETT